MTRARIAGGVLLVLLGAGVLTRITNRAGVPPKKTEPAPMAVGMAEGPPDIVDPQTGNIHLQIPIRPLSRVPAVGVPGWPERAIQERVRVEGRRSGCRGVLRIFSLAVGLVLAAPGCGAALPSGRMPIRS
jgi:hypothetical protein